MTQLNMYKLIYKSDSNHSIYNRDVAQDIIENYIKDANENALIVYCTARMLVENPAFQKRWIFMRLTSTTKLCILSKFVKFIKSLTYMMTKPLSLLFQM